MTPSFVDKREIVVNLNHVPDLFNQPSRATTSNFSYKWLGSVDHEFYDALIRVPPNNMPKVIKSTGGESIGLSGEVKNHSSVQLQDVTILWVTEDQIEPSLLETNEEGDLMPWVTKSGIPINKAYMWRMPIWGDELINLNLLNANKSSSFSNSVDYRYTNKEQNFRKLSWRKQLEMLSLYSHLKPPTYIKPSSDTSKTTDSYKSSRDGGRELDFAKWFGRPCLIIMGFLQNSPLPVPISVDGDTIDQSDGVTFVRWIYPLPLTQ
jgi:hypothetical protein